MSQCRVLTALQKASCVLLTPIDIIRIIYIMEYFDIYPEDK